MLPAICALIQPIVSSLIKLMFACNSDLALAMFALMPGGFVKVNDGAKKEPFLTMFTIVVLLESTNDPAPNSETVNLAIRCASTIALAVISN